MQPIDRPFRFTWDFCIVWAMFALGMPFVTNVSSIGPWYGQVAAMILGPLFATFLIYGPVLLVGQIFKSGRYGFLIAKVLLTLFISAVLVLGLLWYSGYFNETRAGWIAFALSVLATTFLEWRTRDGSNKNP
jgi:hypothetical protein